MSTADHTPEYLTDRSVDHPEGLAGHGGDPRRLSLIRGEGSGARHLCLPLEYEVAPGVPAIPPTPTHLHLVGSSHQEVLADAPTDGTSTDGASPDGAANVGAANVGAANVGAANVGAPALPPPGLWTMRLARAIAEVAHGERPAGQLTPHVSREQLLHLSRRGQAVLRHPSSAAQRGSTRLRSVRGVRVCSVAPGVVEASAVLVGGQRAQAIALRLEAVGSNWVATAVELG